MKSKITCQGCGAKAGKVTQKKKGMVTTFQLDTKQTCECSPFLTTTTFESAPQPFSTNRLRETVKVDNLTITKQPSKRLKDKIARVESSIEDIARMLGIDH